MFEMYLLLSSLTFPLDILRHNNYSLRFIQAHLRTQRAAKPT